MKENTTSWQHVSEWYGDTVGRKGNYYHQHIILPQSLKLLSLKKGSSLLDLACGQGILARQIPKEVRYEGVDISRNLIEQASSLDKNRAHIYHVADIVKELPLQKNFFSHAAIILALQNVENLEGVIGNVQKHLKKSGKFLIVLNHPCFRTPRQTRWEIDERSRIQYRRIDRYMTPLKVPISIHPGRGARSEITWSYHIPLSEYSRMLFVHGFVIEQLEEWISDKRSIGEAAKMENRARSEFPLFMAILARKD